MYVKNVQCGSLSFTDLTSGDCESQTIYSINNACKVMTRQRNMVEHALHSAGHKVFIYDTRKSAGGRIEHILKITRVLI